MNMVQYDESVGTLERRTEHVKAADGAASPGVKSADRTVELLELLSRTSEPLTLSEIQRELSYPKSSLFVLLRTLVARGWVETDRRGTGYSIGVRALLVGTSYLDRDPVIRAATRVLEELRAEVNETVHLARLDGPDVVYLASRESAHQLRLTSRVGRRLPAHATSLGKALLAQRSDRAAGGTTRRAGATPLFMPNPCSQRTFPR